MADENKPAEGAGEGGPSAGARPGQPAEAGNEASDAVAKPAAEKSAAPAAEKPKPAAKPKAPPTMEVSPWEDELAGRLKERFGERIKEFSVYREQPFVVVTLGSEHETVEHLKSEEGFDYLVDVTAVDYPKREKRFDVVWILYSHPHNRRIRVKVEAGEGEAVQSVVPIHQTSDWLEREVFDMFGIEFAGHPKLTRILLPDEWSGYPLRKDYSIIQQDEQWVRENLHIESGQ